uniref:Non-haem dioxygenase N-terminal domain-containing protein n=1 Tax=Triticum urartu TaxID=4572 RepID=A0A8R7V0U5_TRIUA
MVRGHHDQQLAMAVAAPIPVIDLCYLFKEDGAATDEASKLRSALESWGLFHLSNHGIEATMMDDMMSASREFFWRPLEDKQRYNNLIGGEQFQFEGYGNNRVRSPYQILDWSDRIYLKVEPEDERHITLWSTHPENFRDVLHEFTKKCGRVKDDVLRAMAKLLELDNDDYFVDQLVDQLLPPVSKARACIWSQASL